MNFAKKIGLLTGVVATAVGCNYLDYDENKNWSDREVWSDFDYIERSLTSLYYRLPDGFISVGDGFFDTATDNGETLDSSSGVTRFNLGNWNEFNNPDCTWDKNYEGIYLADIFINNADTVTLYNQQYNLSELESNLKYLEYFKGEARFLKAFFYFELMKRYGEVPIVEEWVDEYTPLDFSRSPIEDVVAEIALLCDESLEFLPKKSSFNSDAYGSQLGRIFQGAAYALKCRAYLYAASELFDSPQRNSFYKESAKSAAKLFELGEYSLEGSYASLFEPAGSTMMNNNEVILDVRFGGSNTLETTNLPIGFYNASGEANPSQNLVDAYELKDLNSDGTPHYFDWSTDDLSTIYDNRDDRFDATILHNGSAMDDTGAIRAVETFEGGLDASNSVVDGTRTGYYLRKYINTDADMVESETSRKYWPLFRYSEVLLNYAEALNEIRGVDGQIVTTDYESIDAIDADCTTTPLAALNEVRMRAGLQSLANIDQSDLRDAIRRERRVELAFEDHRHWDVRRWKIANETIGQPLYGVKITPTLNSSIFKYEKIEVEERCFEDKMYLYPLPSSEVLIANPLPQNSGW